MQTLGNKLDRLMGLRQSAFFFALTLASAHLAGNVFASLYAALSTGLAISFGFVINNLFDAKYDSKLSNNPIARKEISYKSAVLVASVLLVLFLLPLLLIDDGKVRTLLLASIILFAAYSAPPFRFKEKGPWDVLTHALVTASPVAVGWLSVRALNQEAIGLVVLAAMLGYGVSIDQEIRDFKSDKLNGFRTTVVLTGPKSAYALSAVFTFLSFIISAYFIYSGIFPASLTGLAVAFLYGIVMRLSHNYKNAELFMHRIWPVQLTIVALVYFFILRK